jgi:flagellar assembly protein FliH
MLLAEAMLSEAEEKGQKIYEEAYTKGFQHGQSDAEAKVLEETETLLDYLRDLGQAISLSQEKVIMSAEESIGKLALAVAGKLIRREIHADESVVEDIVRESLEAVKSGNSIKLKVNARDIDRIRDCKDILLQAADNIPDFEIVEDPRIEQGGCIIETDFGIVDARIDSQLQEIGRAFFGNTHT